MLVPLLCWARDPKAALGWPEHAMIGEVGDIDHFNYIAIIRESLEM
jgi:hypothetical protein